MLRFFRQIRQRLFTDHQIGKYILYVIVEIIIVIIGILIAIQVNNWNDDRKNIAQERLILQNIHRELESNNSILEECAKQVQFRMDCADTLQFFVGPKYPGLKKRDILQWISYSSAPVKCIPSTDVIDELRSSGFLKIISSAEVRHAISRWSSGYDDLKIQETEWDRDLSMHFLPYLNKWISWDDIDYYNFPDNPSYMPSKFDYDPNKLLQEFEFTNELDIQHWRMRRVQHSIKSLLDYTKILDSLLTKDLSRLK